MSRDGYRASTVTRLTGFSPALLRMWERRFEFLSPTRAPSRRRIYRDEDVRVLLRVRQLRDQGRSIGEIALLGRRALLAAVPRVEQVAPPPPPPINADPGGAADITAGDAVIAIDGHGRVLHATAELERLLGWFPVEVVGLPLSSLVAASAADRRLLELGESGHGDLLVGRTLQLTMIHRTRAEIPVELACLFARPAVGGLLLVCTVRPARPWDAPDDAVERSTEAAARRLMARLDLDSVWASLLDTLIEDEGVARAELWLRGPRAALQLRASAGTSGSARTGAFVERALTVARTVRYDRLARRRSLDGRWIARHQLDAAVVAPIALEPGAAPVGALVAFARAERVPQASTVEALAGLAAAALRAPRP
ncbi:MAG: MerR family transcriptional regulator [Kofleriaceae bacterium]